MCNWELKVSKVEIGDQERVRRKGPGLVVVEETKEVLGD